MKNAVFWDVAPCDSCQNRLFGGTYRVQHQGDKNRRNMNNVFLRNVFRLLVAATIPTSPILTIPMMDAIHSSETSVLTETTRRRIAEDVCLLRC
jgi:hypothetical protein